MSASDRPAAMTPDDPRLAAWVEGRLSPAEAAEVERIVRGSKQLARTVAHLRSAAGGDSDACDDAEVADEWRRIEQERIAGERAEAMEDVAGEQAAGAAPAGDQPRGRWPMVAMAAALAAGVLFAFVINRPGRRDQEQGTIPGDETAAGPVEQGHGPRAAATRGPSTGVAEGMVVRVSLRDDLGRGKLEEALAAGDLRIAVGQPAGADAAPTAAADGPAEWLSVEGPPAAIDALLAALSEPSESLVAEPAPAAGDAGQKATEPTGMPASVRISIEIVDQTTGGRATRAGEGGQP